MDAVQTQNKDAQMLYRAQELYREAVEELDRLGEECGSILASGGDWAPLWQRWLRLVDLADRRKDRVERLLWKLENGMAGLGDM